MIMRNRKVLALEYEPAGSDDHVDFRSFRAACDRFMRKRNMFKAKLVPPARGPKQPPAKISNNAN